MPRSDKARQVKAFERYSNIQELLNNWYEIRMHCINATIDYDKVEEILLHSLIDNTYIDPDAHIRSITRSKQYTQILVTHIDNMIATWGEKCGHTQEGRLKRRIIRQYYFDYPSKSLHKIADSEHKSYDFIREQRDKALKELSALIFGADGLLKVDGAMYVHTFEDPHMLEGTLRSGG